MARRYVWDRDPDDALAEADRTIRRVMDLGTIEDVFAMEEILGRPRLVDALATTPPGGLRPRSWWFWHYRLGLTEPGADPPPMPLRVIPG